jgi:Kef-type K+ transport system membrane component KefB
MSAGDSKGLQFDAQQVVFLPLWARALLLTLLALLGVSAAVGGLYFLTQPQAGDRVVSLMAVAQTAIGAFAVVLFVLFAEKQLSTTRLYKKTDQFLDLYLPESLSRIEIPQIKPDHTMAVTRVVRPSAVHGRRKDIFGCNYRLSLGGFEMKVWVGINVKRLSVIYFAKVGDSEDADKLKQAFRFTFAGAEKVGYHTHFEHAIINGEHIVSMWSTVFAENAILGNPAEQLFWTQDVAMMTQSLARTAARSNQKIDLNPVADPGPL